MDRNIQTKNEELGPRWKAAQWILLTVGSALLVISLVMTGDHWIFGSPVLGFIALFMLVVGGLIASHNPDPYRSLEDQHHNDDWIG